MTLQLQVIENLSWKIQIIMNKPMKSRVSVGEGHMRHWQMKKGGAAARTGGGRERSRMRRRNTNRSRDQSIQRLAVSRLIMSSMTH